MEKLKRSISKRSKFLTVKPLWVNTDMVVFSGNQRLRACIALGIEKVPCYVLDWTEEEQREAMIIENTHNGEWDTDMLANDGWDVEELQEMGVFIDWEKPEPEDKPKELKQCKHCDKMIP